MKVKHAKGTVVYLQENGKDTQMSTNLSHHIEIENGDTFTIDFGHNQIEYKVVDCRFPIVAEEISPLDKITSATDEELKQLWDSLKTQIWNSETMYSEQENITMDDYGMCLYSELCARGISRD